VRPQGAIRAPRRHRTRTQLLKRTARGRAARGLRGLRPPSPQATSTFSPWISQDAVRGHKQRVLQVAHRRPYGRARPLGEAIQRRVQAVSSQQLVGLAARGHPSAGPFRRRRSGKHSPPMGILISQSRGLTLPKHLPRSHSLISDGPAQCCH
jgi:hypothetical protein